MVVNKAWLIPALRTSLNQERPMRDEYDPEFDSPEARANHAARNIRNLVKRRERRNELLKQFQAETVVEMFPGRKFKINLERIKKELEWIGTERLIKNERKEICQCSTEKVIKRSRNPERMRASLLSLVFIDQFVYAHYPKVYRDFNKEFHIPKLRQHSFGGNASPSWFVYSRRGYDKAANWSLVSETFADCIRHLRRWLIAKLDRSVPELKILVEREIENEFEPEHQSKFSAPIGA